ncbi:MAG: energy-coupled thiamine transporter ThiT [Armatimonadetes bacterium]|nr:energy-coupled thiamine transporter ThiT [Armatimonadota bacterium]
MSIALAFILSYFKLYRLPYGGEVSLEMLPLIILARQEGFAVAFWAGFAFGLIHSIQDFYFLHPFQFLLDYPVAYASLSLASFFNIYTGIFLAFLGRFLCHFSSGIFFFAQFSKAPNPWIYVIVYNVSYLVPEIVLVYILAPWLIKKIGGAS